MEQDILMNTCYQSISHKRDTWLNFYSILIMDDVYQTGTIQIVYYLHNLLFKPIWQSTINDFGIWDERSLIFQNGVKGWIIKW